MATERSPLLNGRANLSDENKDGYVAFHSSSSKPLLFSLSLTFYDRDSEHRTEESRAGCMSECTK